MININILNNNIVKYSLIIKDNSIYKKLKGKYKQLSNSDIEYIDLLNLISNTSLIENNELEYRILKYSDCTFNIYNLETHKSGIMVV